MRTLPLLLLLTPAGVAAERLYFPPPGEHLDVQSVWSPERAGFHPQILSALANAAPRWALWRWGRLVRVEGDFNELKEVASNRKTWQAMLVGASLHLGKIPSLHQKISVWNPELKGLHAQATWRDVITQSAGFDYPYGNFPAFRPGEMWTYSDLNLVNLCNAIARAWGHRDYRDRYESIVRAAYFDAIGLKGWKIHEREDGIGFYFDLEDMGRLGLLALARGEWNGKRLVPEWYVRELETKQTRGKKVNYHGPNDGDIGLDPAKFPEAPYGYLTWTNAGGDYYPGADRGWAFAWGRHGSYTLWNHKYGIVFAAIGAPSEPVLGGNSVQTIEAHIRK